MNRAKDRLIDRGGKRGGCRDVLRVAFPLVLSTSSWGLMHFVDRMFLSWYSNDALAAAVPGSVTNFVLVAFFLGTATYVNTFIAQYIGAGRPRQVGSVLWQGIYFSVFSGIFLLGVIPFAGHLFRLVGHDAAVQEMEVPYFRILCYGSGASILGSTLSCFFIGRGKTLTVMWVNITATAANLLLDYAWIFGNWGFPEAGIRGALRHGRRHGPTVCFIHDNGSSSVQQANLWHRERVEAESTAFSQAHAVRPAKRNSLHA